MTMAAIDLDGLLRRLHLPTIRRLYADLAARAEVEEMSHRDFLAILVAEEVAHRGETRIQRSVRAAHFPFLATIESFDFTFQTSVKLQLLGSFLGPELLSEGRSLILCGPTGLGKTHLAVAIAYRAIQNGATALFREANALVHELSEASRIGCFDEAIEPYLHAGVLVVDEVGYLAAPPDAANVLFQVVNQRYLKKRPMIFTTNKPLAAWADVLHDADLAEAIIDRVLAHGRFLELRGSSYRTRHLKHDVHTPRPLQAQAGARAADGQAGGKVAALRTASELSTRHSPSAAPDPAAELEGDPRTPVRSRHDEVARVSGNTVPEFPEPTTGTASRQRGSSSASRRSISQTSTRRSRGSSATGRRPRRISRGASRTRR